MESKWDEIQARIYHEQVALEDMEDDFRREQKKFEEQTNHLDETRYVLQNHFEQIYEIVSSDFRKMENADEDNYRQAVEIINQFLIVNDEQFRRKVSIVQDQFFDLEDEYKKRHYQQEEKVESLYRELRRAYDEEQEGRRL